MAKELTERDTETVFIPLMRHDFKTIMEALSSTMTRMEELPSGGNAFAIYDYLADELPKAVKAPVHYVIEYNDGDWEDFWSKDDELETELMAELMTKEHFFFDTSRAELPGAYTLKKYDECEFGK